MKGHCPDCGELVEVSATGEVIPGKTGQRYWQLVRHKRVVRFAEAEQDAWYLAHCDGSGKKI